MAIRQDEQNNCDCPIETCTQMDENRTRYERTAEEQIRKSDAHGPRLSHRQHDLNAGHHDFISSCQKDQMPSTSIAICGLALRLPGGVNDAEAFWDVLENGKDTRAPIPLNRLNRTGEKIHSEHSYYLQEDLFDLDTSFFNMSKSELEMIDPQQRKLLEITRECFESAGEASYRGKRIGVFVGTFGEDWMQLVLKENRTSGSYALCGYSDLMLANRVSYEYDLRGPSIVAKTGCSASLTALHQACSSLKGGDCEAALVAGTNLVMGPTSTSALEGVLSPEASSKTFDASADGYARGEAVNAVYLKRFEDAVRDGNPIRAVIRGTGVNGDGRSNGIMVPNGKSHEALMREVYSEIGLNPKHTAFVECHGTGTQTGDSIEATAVGNVFGERGVMIGSVKPNVGHSEGASGITSLIKAILALEKKMIPPNIKFTTPNPRIPFKEKGLVVPVHPTPLPSGRAQRISISSYGIGGSNAHVILDSLEEVRDASTIEYERSKSGTERLIVISANTQESLRRMIRQYEVYLEKQPLRVHDLAYNLACRREGLLYRTYAVMDSTSQLSTAPAVKAARGSPDIVLVFNGQGSQWPEMAKELIALDINFRQDLLEMEGILQSLRHPASWSILEELHRPALTSRVNIPEFSQPLCTAVQIALLNLYKRAAVRPSAVLGHSSGEIAAAYAAGGLSMRQAIVIAYYRGLVCRIKPVKGGMAAFGLRKQNLVPYLTDRLVIACENSPMNFTVSGDVQDLAAMIEKVGLDHPDAPVRQLKVDVPYHSNLLCSLAPAYEELLWGELGTFQTNHPLDAPFFSTVLSQTLENSSVFAAEYWSLNLTSPVMFDAACTSVLQVFPNCVFLEIGPHSTLASALKQICSDSGRQSECLAAMERKCSAYTTLLSSFGRLYQSGVEVDLTKVVAPGEALPDLPAYPWDHSTSLRPKNRIINDWLSAATARHPLLGQRVPETSAGEPSWRATLNIEEIDWLAHHRLHNEIVFPLAGYVIMAGAAMQQIHGSPGFSMRHIVAHTALVLADTETSEIVTSLRRHRLTDRTDSEWFDFTISSYSGSAWVQHCHGQVKPCDQILGCDSGQQSLSRTVSESHWYESARAVGIDYGPAFQGLKNITTSVQDHKATAQIEVPTAYVTPSAAAQACVLDSSFQLCLIALTNGLVDTTGLMMPTLIDELQFIPISGVLKTEAWGSDKLGNNGIASFFEDQAVLRIAGMHITPLDSDHDDVQLDRHAGAYIEWGADFDFIDPRSLFSSTDNMIENRLVEKMAYLCMLDSVDRLQACSTKIWHLEKYGQWLRKQVTEAAAGKYSLVEDGMFYLQLSSGERTKAIDDMYADLLRIPSKAAVATGLMRLQGNMESIFDGTMDPLELLLRDGVLTEMYTMVSIECGDFVKSLAHKKPNLRILEVGAGTGGTTHRILEKLLDLQPSNPPYASYTFTDISAGFFPQAQERFSHAPNLEYCVFDISKDPLEQGLMLQSFDLIIASNCVHATPSLKRTLSNLCKVLSPDGHLVLSELCTPSRIPGYLFGIFSGWWLGEQDDREEQPFVSLERWNSELLAAGFAGIGLSVFDNQEPYQYSAAIVAQPQQGTRAVPHHVTVLCKKPLEGVSYGLATQLESAGLEVSFACLGDILPKGGHIISSIDLEDPVAQTMTEEMFQKFQRTVKTASLQSLLWLMPNGQTRCHAPNGAARLGLLRSLRAELGLPIVTLEIDTEEEKLHEHIYNVFSKSWFSPSSGQLQPDCEFVVDNGVVKISRYQPFNLGDALTSERSVLDVHAVELGVTKPGLLDAVHWQAKESQCPTLAEDHVEIEVCTIGLNFRDVALLLGLISSETKKLPLGLEVAGVVKRRGNKVTKLEVGDRVFAISHGGLFASSVHLTSSLVARIPDDMSFEDAATIPLCFATVLRALVEVGQLEKGQTVLIHSACGGIGHAAIQVCQALGAEIYATVGTAEKAKYLASTFSIPRERIFSSHNTTFLPSVLDATNGRGVDIVLNSLSGELLHASWKCVAEFGMMIELGKKDLQEFAKLDMRPFTENRSYCCVNLAPMMEKMPSKVGQLLRTCLRMYQRGQISAIHPVTIFQATEVQQALRHMQSGTHIGKVVIQLPKDVAACGITPLVRELTFSAESSYLLTGGLGGLGRIITSWMVRRGARNFVFLSRRAGMSVKHTDFLADLRELGCSAEVALGNAENADDVAAAVRMARTPIRGVIHLAMTLRDIPFVSMTHKDWAEVASPKVDGAWNLHNALHNHHLDFFLLASSLIGSIIEVPGESHYSAANTFLEAFCRYRQNLGLPASVLSICPIKDAGFVHENPAAKKSVQAQALYFISKKELLHFVELAILRSNAGTHAVANATSHIIMGLRSDKPLGDPNNHIVWRQDRRMGFYHNLREHSLASSDCNKSDPLRTFMAQVARSPETLSEPATAELLAMEIGRKIFSLMMKPDEDLNHNMELAHVGLDSLMSIELRRWWKSVFRLDVTVLEIMGAGTLLELGKKVAKGLLKKLMQDA